MPGTRGKIVDWQYREACHRVAEALGRAPSEMVGQRVSQLLPHRFAHLHAVWSQVLATGQPTSYEVRHAERDYLVGSLRVGEAAVGSIALDVTALRERERRLCAVVARAHARSALPDAADAIGADERVSGRLGTSRLRAVLDAIEASIAEPLTVIRLAEVAELSPAHFARAFKTDMGETPHAYVMRRRSERAHELIRSGTSIADAALRCGFSDQAHLSRTFKRRFGVTPGLLVRVRRGV